MATVIDALVIELGLDGSKFKSGASQAKKGMDDVTKGAKDTAKSIDVASSSLFKGAAALGAFLGVAVSISGLKNLVDKVTELNTQLSYTSKNLGTSAQSLKEWQNTAEMMGGTADGVTSSMQNLVNAQSEMSITGTTGALPYFRALGISMFDAQGNARSMNDILLQSAGRFEGMDRAKANFMGKGMGYDQSTMNMLLEGKDAVRDMLETQKQMRKPTDEEIKASRELMKARTKLNQQFESLGIILVGKITPYLVKITQLASKFVEFLMKHEKFTRAFFVTMAAVIAGLLIPALLSAATATWALLAPILLMAAPVLAVAAAFGLLYDDYKTWADGGNSLFDWTLFHNQISKAGGAVNLLNGAFLDLIGGYTSWSQVGRDAFDWLKFLGFIKDAKVSVDSLTDGFKNLAKSIWNELTPQFQHVLTMLGDIAVAAAKFVTGDFKGAADAWNNASSIATGSWSESMNRQITGAGGNSENQTTWQSNGAGSGGTGAYSKVSGRVGKGFTKEKADSIARVAKNIGVNPNDLAAVISFETAGSFNPAAKNPGSSATGLIQFMNGTDGHKGYYGMSRDQFSGLGFDEQMNYVEKYFKERGFKAGKNKNVGDVYGAVTGYGYKRGSKAYEQNKVWDSNGNGVVEKGEMVQNPSFRAHQKQYFQATQFAQQASNAQRYGQSSNSSTNNTEVAMNGDIKIYTSASTVHGTVSEAMDAMRGRISLIHQHESATG